MKILVTGAAGFIGMHVSQLLLARGDRVVGLDNLNDYYSPALKRDRLARLLPADGFRFVRMDVADRTAMGSLFAEEHSRVEHLVYASSSSVYGGNTKMPFSEHDNIDHPVSMYAATKKANELMAHTYSHLFGLATTGLRFFTVYGPWGRPDMALFLFAKAILEGRPIDVFNHGQMVRDFTYIDDIAEGVVRVLDHPAAADPEFDPAQPDPARSNSPYRVFNIGNCDPVKFMPLQDGDVPATCADVTELTGWTGFKPGTPVRQGIGRFVDWYRGYYKV
jgi:UDP-glucuronate 4-epimerase